MATVLVDFLDGPFKGCRTNLREERPRVEIKGHVYALITDPETGDSLHAYALEVTG